MALANGSQSVVPGDSPVQSNPLQSNWILFSLPLSRSLKGLKLNDYIHHLLTLRLQIALQPIVRLLKIFKIILLEKVCSNNSSA